MRIGIATLLLILLCPIVSYAQDAGTAYAFDLRTRDNFLSFPADDPSGLSFIDKNASPFALDFDNAGTTLYAVDSNTAQVGTLDQTAGTFSAVAMLTGDYAGGTVTGMSSDPTTGDMFICTATTLFSLDVNTGATVQLGTFANSDPLGPVPGTIIDIAIDNSGQMYAHELDPDNTDLAIGGGLWEVDKTNALCTFVSVSGLEAVFAQGMDFDPDTNTLYAAIYTGGGTGFYGTWDTTTGIFTQIVDLPSFGPVELEMAISGGTTFAYDFRGTPDSFFTFPVDNPLPVTSEEDVQVYATFAMDFDNDGNLVLYDNGTNTFGTIDKKTGCYTPGPGLNGDLADDPNGMSIDPSTGICWVVGEGPAAEQQLYMVDLTTGATTFVIDLINGGGLGGLLTLVVDIAFDNDGNLYCYDIAEDTLFEVNIGSGLATPVGMPGVGDSNFAQGMDFDPTTNTLYQAVYTGGGTGSYGSWDLTTGTFTEILSLPMFFDPLGTGYELEVAIDGAGVLLGDINCDGVVDLLDVAPFIDLLTSGGFSPKADFNGDGMVTLLDVEPFVQLLSGG